YKIMEKKNLISRKIAENPKNTTPHKEGRELQDQNWAIERPLRASILLCPACFKSDKDITFNPVRKEWYCTECYAKPKKGFTEDGEPEQFP
ncbi:MAG: hypothetical protein ACFFBK_13105, partial [Promethearchaeota archaeon]